MNSRPKSLELTQQLIAFDTTSRNSNLELIEFVKGYLEGFGIQSELVFDADKRKANLFATIGATDKGGIALSGHTDVVPTDGQNWNTDPYDLQEIDGRLYGRGTSDMKAFIGVCLAKVPDIVDRNLETPFHLAFSYDEEIGCVGIHTLLDVLKHRSNKPVSCLIGEPTGMQVVVAHKGKHSKSCTIHGLEAHSSLVHQGVNTVEAAAEMIAFLKGIARRFRDEGPFDDRFDPPYTTVHTGVITGGTALNIVPKHCQFEVEVRHLPDDDPQEVWDQLQEFVNDTILPEMHAVDPTAGIQWQELSYIPKLQSSDDELVRLAQKLAHRTDTTGVSFGTEAGLYELIGVPAVVCGPGHVDQAHKPNEYIEINQLKRCEDFIDDLLDQTA